jgi:hypothetical protein
MVLARLMRVTLPATRLIDIVWDQKSEILYLIGASARDIAAVQDFFMDGFGLHLEDMSLPAALDGGIPEFEEFSFTGKPAGSSVHDADRAIMNDFISFLWFYGDRYGGVFEKTDGSVIAILPGESIIVAGDNEEISCFGSRMVEAVVGFMNGKKAVKASFILTDEDEMQTRFKLGPLLTLNGLSLPASGKIENDDEPDAAFLEKIYLLEKAWRIVDQALKLFKEARLDEKTWMSALAEINMWAREILANNETRATVETMDSGLWKKWLENRF